MKAFLAALVVATAAPAASPEEPPPIRYCVASFVWPPDLEACIRACRWGRAHVIILERGGDPVAARLCRQPEYEGRQKET